MTSRSPASGRVAVRTSRERASPLALAIFLAAYAGVLVIVLAPEGAFVEPPGAALLSAGP